MWRNSSSVRQQQVASELLTDNYREARIPKCETLMRLKLWVGNFQQISHKQQTEKNQLQKWSSVSQKGLIKTPFHSTRGGSYNYIIKFRSIPASCPAMSNPFRFCFTRICDMSLFSDWSTEEQLIMVLDALRWHPPRHHLPSMPRERHSSQPYQAVFMSGCQIICSSFLPSWFSQT